MSKISGGLNQGLINKISNGDKNNKSSEEKQAQQQIKGSSESQETQQKANEDTSVQENKPLNNDQSKMDTITGLKEIKTFEKLQKNPSKNVLKKAKSMISDMMASPKESIGQSLKFTFLIDSMNDQDLASLAGHIRGLIDNTGGKDAMLEGLLDQVRNEIGDSSNIGKINPEDFIAKYSCVYSTRSISIK